MTKFNSRWFEKDAFKSVIDCDVLFQMATKTDLPKIPQPLSCPEPQEILFFVLSA